MIAFMGQKKVGPRPDWSPLFPTSIPAPFIWESHPLPPVSYTHLTLPTNREV